MNTPFTYLHKAPVMNTEKKPAIFLLHGLGSDENDLLQLVNSFSTQCHIFSLQGPIQHRPGYAFYTFEEEGKPNRTIFDKVLKGIEAFIKEAVQEYNLDEQQLYVVGFNQGAALAQSLAMVMGDTIRGTAALSGYLPEFAALEYSKKRWMVLRFSFHMVNMTTTIRLNGLSMQSVSSMTMARKLHLNHIR